MIRKLMTVAVATVVAASTREAAAQVQATVVAPAPAVAAPAPGGEHYRLPVSYVERGITNPERILSPEVDFGVVNAPNAAGGHTALADLAVMAGYSITDDFGVRATVIPLQFNSPFSYLGPSVGATYRFMKGDFEMGAAADLTVQTCGNAGCYNPQTGVAGTGAGVVFVPSVPMHLHFGKVARLDFQPGIPITDVGYGPAGHGATVGLSVPVQFAYDIIEPLHVGAMTGFGMNFNNTPVGLTAGQSVYIPFGIFGGYAIAGKEGPMLDIDPFFLWPTLFTPGAAAGASKAQGGFFEVGVNVTYYLYL